MVSVSLLLAVLSAAPAGQSVPPRPAELSTWLVRCDASPAVPSLDPLAVEAAIAGTGPAPEGWRVQTLPMPLQGTGCWFARRLGVEQDSIGLWAGRGQAAWTVHLDGALIWTRGREAGPYWRSDQGFRGFIVPPQALTESAGRLMLLRVAAPVVGLNVAPLRQVDPREFPQLTSDEGGLTNELIWAEAMLLAVIALIAFGVAAVRRSSVFLYFAVGTGGFASLLAAISVEWVPFDNTVLTRISAPAIFASFPFFAVFFQRVYGIHDRPLYPLIAAAQLAVATLLSIVLPATAQVTLIQVGMPLYLGSLGYAAYLNVRAYRAGDEVARVVIWGFGLFIAFILLEVVNFVATGPGNEARNSVFQYGMVGFVGAILIAVARRFFRVAAEAQRMLGRLQDAGAQLNGMVVNLQSAATQLSSATAEQVSAITETASTTTEMNQTSVVSAARCAELIGKGEAAASVVEDGKNAATTSREAMEAISGALGSVSTASRDLSQKVQRIDRIIDTVGFLADQSAALAINASIEASRAGEAGQGFGAVAREVRSLANDSRRATAEVREVLDEIRTRTLQMESQVSQGEQTVTSGVRQVSRLSEVVGSLGDTIHSAVGLMRQVEASARQHQAGVEQVLQAVTSIQRASESIRDGAEQLTTLSRRASDLSSGLAAKDDAPPRAEPPPPAATPSLAVAG